MHYMLTPYAEQQESLAWWEGAFSDQELNMLQQRARSANEKAQVGGGVGGTINPEIRRSELNWVNHNQETSWIFERLAHVVSSLNSQFFRFDLTGFGEPIQLTNYNSSEHGMYGWHVDFGSNGPSRKLSLVMQLSDPSDYEGGNLELKPHGNDTIKIKKQRGLIAVFPSWTLHQVTPVTQGSRQSLVSWITGPAFK